MASEQTVLEIEAGRMAAIAASVEGTRIRVRQFDVSLAGLGAGASGEDAAALGSAVRGRMESARLPRRGVTLVVPRAEVVVKALSLPGAVLEDEGELATAVRLQMARQLTMSVEGTAIDYAGPDVSAGDGDGGATRTLLAGALPSGRATWWREVAQGAGVRVAHMRMKAFAIAEIVGELTQRRAESVLAVAIGPGSVEFVLVEDGKVVSSRAADVVAPEATASESEQIAFRDRVGVEARRAALPMLSTGTGRPRGSVEPTLIAVVGEGATASAIGSACGSALGLAWTTVGTPAGVELPAEMTDLQRTLALPLVGALLGPARGRRGLDFAQPRKAPDPKAKARQVVLAGVLLAMLAGGAAYVVGDQVISGKRQTLEAYKAQEKALRERIIAANAADARLRHMDLSRRAHADWLEHLAEISTLLPAGTELRLDEVSGTLAPRVEVTPAAPYSKTKWASSARASFTLSGSMKDRDANADLRERVLASGLYTLQMPTADTPDRFTLRLVDVNAAPVEAEKDAAKRDAPKKDSGKKGDAQKDAPAKGDASKTDESATGEGASGEGVTGAHGADATPKDAEKGGAE